MSKTKKIILAGLLLALLIILTRPLAINTPLLVLSFGFVPIIMSAIWLGPKWSMLIAALGDLIGALIFPFGAYFPGFTISAAISGCFYGVFLYNKEKKEINYKNFIIKLSLSSILVLGMVNIFINSFWLQTISGSAYLVIVGTRVVAQIFMLPIQIIVIYTLEKLTRPLINKYLYEE